MLPLLREVVRAHHNAEQLSAEIGGVSRLAFDRFHTPSYP